MKKSKPDRRQVNFRIDPGTAEKIRRYIKAKGLLIGPFFATAALEKIDRERTAA
jgi:hypothetical protein